MQNWFKKSLASAALLAVLATFCAGAANAQPGNAQVTVRPSSVQSAQIAYVPRVVYKKRFPHNIYGIRNTNGYWEIKAWDPSCRCVHWVHAYKDVLGHWFFFVPYYR